MTYSFTRAGAGGATTVTPQGAGAGAFAPAATTAADPRRERAGELLVQLFTYLERNAGQHQRLLDAAPVLRSAIADYRTNQAADPYDGVRRVLQAIQAVRAADPSIPDA